MWQKKNKLKILFVTTELQPFVGVGGLGHVMQALPEALSRLGHDARVYMPRYLSIDNQKFGIEMEQEGLEVPSGSAEGPTHLICNVRKNDGTENKKPTVYFLENQEYYEKRANVYGYADDTLRWMLLSRGAVEFLRFSDWKPDIIVCSDWQTGFLSNYLKTTYKGNLDLKIPTLMMIHNLSYQGNFNHRFVQEMDYDDGHSELPSFDDKRLFRLNGMRRGILFSDMICAVSPTYAKEITTEEYGEGLNDLVKERRDVLHGILNGISYDVWNSENDPLIESKFNKNSLSNRALNKNKLQKRFNLPEDPNAYVLGIVARLGTQKGIDLIEGIIKTVLRELNVQLVVVGEGNTNSMAFFQDLEKEFPNKVGTHLKHDGVLAHVVFAGADSVLVPSRFEPCGLTQMEAMHYGAVPIVRFTGGLADTVIDYHPENTQSTGFVFKNYDPSSLLIAIIRGYENFKNKNVWSTLQKKGMSEDFSWDNSAKKYESLINETIELYKKKNNI